MIYTARPGTNAVIDPAGLIVGPENVAGWAAYQAFITGGGVLSPVPATPIPVAVAKIRSIAYAAMEALYTFADANGTVINRQPSVQRYAIQLSATVASGSALTAEQEADAQTLLAASATEQAILNEMNTLIAQAATGLSDAALATANLAATWPVPATALAVLVAQC